MSSQGLPAEKTAQLTPANTVKDSLSNIIIRKSGMLVFSLIPQMTIKRQSHLKLLPVSLQWKRCTES